MICKSLIGPSFPNYSRVKKANALFEKTRLVRKLTRILIIFYLVVWQFFVSDSIMSLASCSRYTSMIDFVFPMRNSIDKKLLSA